MYRTRRFHRLFLQAVAVTTFACVVHAGDLNPPAGPVGPTMKTLDQIEPRTPISALPFTIGQSGSYYLTGNLTGVSGSNGITILAGDVTLDLKGFRLVGTAGALDGINATGAIKNVVIRNGTITSWPGDGVDTQGASSVRIEKIRVQSSGEVGIRTGANTTVDSCHAENATGGIAADAADCRIINCTAGPTTGKGIQCGDRAIISGCAATSNDDVGISAGNDATVSQCTAQANGNTGILTLSGSTVRSCTAQLNTIDGIDVGAGSTVTDSAARGNLDDGINAGTNCTVVNCTASSNSDVGITTGSGCGVISCTASLNGINAGAPGRHGIALAVGCQATNCTARSNQGNGISATDACSITASNCSSNRGDGILVGSDCKVSDNNLDSNGATSGDGAGLHATGSDNRLDGNNATDNDRGIDVDGTGNFIVRNSASGNSGGNNYDIVAGNSVGDIVDVSGMTITASNPWQNVSY